MFGDWIESYDRERQQYKNVKKLLKTSSESTHEVLEPQSQREDSLAVRGRPYFHMSYKDISRLFCRFQEVNQSDLNQTTYVVSQEKLKLFIRKAESFLSNDQTYALNVLDDYARRLLGLDVVNSEDPSVNRPFYRGYIFAMGAMQKAKKSRLNLDANRIFEQGFYVHERPDGSAREALKELECLAEWAQPELCEIMSTPDTMMSNAIAPFVPLSEYNPPHSEREYGSHLALVRAGVGLAYKHACESLDADLASRALMLGLASLSF